MPFLLNTFKSHKMKIVIIGNGMVGFKFCEKLRAKSHPGEIRITVFGEETRPAYDRVHLSEFFSGKSAADLGLATADWYADNNITLHLGYPVTQIDRAAKIVHSHNGLLAPYDYLVLATGSAAFIPSIPRG